MDIVSAFDIFKLSSINGLSDTDLKSMYIKLMKKNHPDVGGTNEDAQNIISAYECLTKFKLRLDADEKLNSELKCKSQNCIIKLSELVKLYNGKDVSGICNGAVVNVNKDNLSKYDVLIEFSANIVYNGESKKINCISGKNSKNTYEINCKIPVVSISDEINYNIHIADKVYSIKSKSRSLKYPIDYDGVMLEVYLERIIIDSNNAYRI